jgi:hypothetical protein
MRRSFAVLMTCAVVAVPLAGAALGATAAKPATNRIYGTSPGTGLVSAPLHSVEILMLIKPKLTVSTGAFTYASNASSLASGLAIGCAKTTTGTGFASLGLPTLHFKLFKGHYRIASSFTRKNVVLPDGTMSTLKVKLTALVSSAKRITGTVSVTGTGCATPSQKFSAPELPASVG